MVVAHVLSSLRVGGGERVALDLAGGQAEAHHDVMVVSLSPPPDGPLGDAFLGRGVAVHRVSKRPGVDLTLLPRLAALFRRERVAVVHTHNRLPLIYGAAAGRMAGAVVVHTRHGPGRGTRREQWLRRGAGYFLKAYVAVSPELRQLAQALGDCAPGKLAVIENGVDLARFGAAAAGRVAARATLGIPHDAWTVGSVGRFAVEKDFPLLIRATAPLLGPRRREGDGNGDSNADGEGRLIIVGDGAEAATVRAEVAAQGVEPFVLLPGARDDIPLYLGALDVFVMSSRMEGLPLVALEAMAAGLPLVATAVGGLPGLIQDGVTGFLVPPGDEAALRRRLQSLRADRDLARAVGQRGQAYVRERHSREAMVRRYLELYAQVGARA